MHSGVAGRVCGGVLVVWEHGGRERGGGEGGGGPLGGGEVAVAVARGEEGSRQPWAGAARKKGNIG
jgi:hypothetical protein